MFGDHLCESCGPSDFLYHRGSELALLAENSANNRLRTSIDVGGIIGINTKQIVLRR